MPLCLPPPVNYLADSHQTDHFPAQVPMITQHQFMPSLLQVKEQPEVISSGFTQLIPRELRGIEANAVGDVNPLV